MKKYNNLYSQIYDKDNLRKAFDNAKKGKRHYTEVKKIEKDVEKYIEQLHNILITNSFKNSEYIIFKKIERKKEREIYKLPFFPDRILHHAILQILEPMWKKVLIRDTYQSIKGRGVSDGKKRIEYIIRKYKPEYYLKLDILKFYPNIDNDILFNIIKKKIKCKNTLNLLKEIIYSVKGVPIGNYISQYFGNLYLSYLDHYIKEQLNVKYYYRYCDDIIILGNKELLNDIKPKIFYYLYATLKLNVKRNWQVTPLKLGLDFLGYKFYYTHTKLRTNIKKSIKRDITNKNKSSYWGWVKSSNSHNLWKTLKIA